MLLRSTLAALCTLPLALPAAAQTILFQDTFDQDLSGWSATNQWAWSNPGAGTCWNSSGESPQGGGAARWGTGCSFNGSLAGNLSMLETVSIPWTAEDPTLRYWSYRDSEGCAGGWDLHYVFLSADGGSSWDLIGDACFTAWGQWLPLEVDLSAYRGNDVLIRFHFDAADWWGNDGFGWVIDDVRITTADCAASNYCTAAPNTFSTMGASMSYLGTRRVHQNNFTLAIDQAPPNQFGHFFYGPDAVYLPVADGYLCVGAGAHGLVRLTPSGQIDAQGHMQRHLDIPATAGSVHAILPGSVWRFQCWFRDPTGGANGSNFSDGLAVTFCE